jgi:uncharacterized lipoprotein YajG
MKYTHILKLGVLVAVLVLAGCAKPADPGQTGENNAVPDTTPTSAPAASTVAQLQTDWTLINFGAPW